MDVSNRTYSSSITTLPGYYCTQIHPGDDILSLFETAKKTFEATKTLQWKLAAYSTNPEGLPEVAHYIEESHYLRGNRTTKDRFNLLMSVDFYNFFNNKLKSIHPNEAGSYYTALKYINIEYLTKDFTKLTSHDFLDIIRRINLCAFQTFDHIGYRNTPAYIANKAIIPESPEQRNKESFKKIDAYILKEYPKQKKLWGLTRKKIWDSVFSKQPPTSSPEFTNEEKDLLRNIISFTADPTKIQLLMHEFTDELCRKIAAKEEIISLMGWAHEKIVEIHPFCDGNGRTARLFMNLLAMWTGKKPFLITNKKEYSLAARSLNPVEFSNYLRGLENKQVQISEFFDNCLKARFDDCCRASGIDSVCNKIKLINLTDL